MRNYFAFVALMLWVMCFSCKDKSGAEPIPVAPKEPVDAVFDLQYSFLEDGTIRITDKSILLNRKVSVNGGVYVVKSYNIVWTYERDGNTGYVVEGSDATFKYELNGEKKLKLAWALKIQEPLALGSAYIDTVLTFKIKNAIYEKPTGGFLKGRVFNKKVDVTGFSSYIYTKPDSFSPTGISVLSSGFTDGREKFQIVIFDKNKYKLHTVDELYSYFSQAKILPLLPDRVEQTGWSVRLDYYEKTDNTESSSEYLENNNTRVEIVEVEKVSQLPFIDRIKKDALDVTFRIKGQLPSGEIDCLYKVRYIFTKW